MQLGTNKTIEVLRGFSAPEFNRFEKLVHSPYFNSNAKVQQLFGALKPFYPAFSGDSLTAQYLHTALFGSKPYKAVDVRLHLSYLHRLSETFIMHEELATRDALKDQLVLSGLDQKGLDRLFGQKLRKATRELEATSATGLRTYYNRVVLEEANYSYQSTRRSRTVDNNLERLLHSLDVHYLYQRLKYSCEILNLQNILSVAYDLSLQEMLVDWLQAHPMDDVPGINIYLKIWLTLREPDNETHYRELKTLLLENLATTASEELRDMFAFAQNYCIRQANFGDSQYLNELFDIYQLLLEHEIISAGKRLTQFDFKNIVTVALRVTAFEWTEQFVDRYTNYLEAPYRENARHYNMARLHFSRGSYRLALRELLNVSYTDVFYELDSRSLLLKTYYELNDFESFLSLTSAFTMFLRRNKEVSDYQRTLYRNQVRFAKKLLRIKMGGKGPVAGLQEEMEKTKQIADLSWLRSKAEELED